MLQEQALKHAIDALESRQIGYMVVGSIASIAYSRPRMTLDIDIVVDLAPAQVPQLLAGFPSAEGYFHFEPAIVQSLIDNIPFNILHTATGLKWDFMPLRRDAYGRSEFARRQRVWFTPTVEGYAASPEDIVIGKLWYYAIGGSQKHLEDITEMWRQRPQLDLAYIERWVEELALADAWKALREFADKSR